MDEARFEQIAHHELGKLEEALGEIDEALDVTLSMGVLTLEFDDGTKYVVNSHRAAKQIWMAAGASAWHFDLEGDEWRDTKGGGDLVSLLQDRVGTKLGRSITLEV